MGVTCYAALNNNVGLFGAPGEYCRQISSANPIVRCCVIGDTCLTNNICQYSHSLEGGSGYYTAGCSDISFGAPCARRCGMSTSQHSQPLCSSMNLIIQVS